MKNQQVITAYKNLIILISMLKKRYGDPNEFLIDFIPDDTYILVV